MKIIAYAHTMHMELGQTQTVFTDNGACPFGLAGVDFDPSYQVTCTPLYEAPDLRELVNRFLSWPVPTDFRPDAGIKFTPIPGLSNWPVGTNLFTADQAKAMFEHVLDLEKPE